MSDMAGNIVEEMHASDLPTLFGMLRRLPMKVEIIQFLKDGGTWFVFYQKANKLYDPVISTDRMIKETAKPTQTKMKRGK